MEDVGNLILSMSDVELRSILGMLAIKHPEDAAEITAEVFGVTRHG